MSEARISGQDLLDALRINLGGLSNAFTTDKQLYFLNLGVSEVWAVIRELELDYFASASQATTPTGDDYFVDLTSAIREYDLPVNCREIRSIECTTSGFAETSFEYRAFDDPDFQAERRAATAIGVTSGGGDYLYTVLGNQIVFARFPETTLRVKIWYIRAIDDIDVSGIPDILFPFNKKIVDYAAKRAVLSSQNLEMTAAWKSEWRDSVRSLALTTGSRDTANAIFISEFTG